MADEANQAPSPSASSMETSEVTTTVTTITSTTTTPTTSEASMATEATSTEVKATELESASVAATENLPLAVAASTTTAHEEKNGEVRDDAEVTRVVSEVAQSLEPPGSTSEQDQASAAAAPREVVPPQEATNDVPPPAAATATARKEEEGKETDQERQMQASVKETTATEEKQQEPTSATQASAGDKRKIEALVDTAVPKENAQEKEATPKKQKIEEVKAAGSNAAQGEVIAPAPVMLSRDDMAKMEEDGGLVKFDVITNDGTPEHMVQLMTLKNIFAKQLPKMPKEYIVRLVFDRNHHSMVILKNGTHVIGGICYRPFLPNHFAEIAFCAINAADQVKGYGTRLMNHLKEYVKKIGITHFLTYADNYAIGYFKKQGFAKVVSMPKPNWFGYIKDYDGGTLMECTIHYQIDYLRITSMVHKQRKAIQDKIKERSRAHITYPGLTKFAEGRLMDIYMIPGVKEAGWSQATIRNSRIGTRDPGSLKTQLMQIWKAVSSHRSAWPFHEPVDTTIVVDYLDYIKDPVDLSLIAKRIESGQYISKAALRADLDRMCENCTIYNTPDTNYYKAAKDLQEFISRRVQIRDSSAK